MKKRLLYVIALLFFIASSAIAQNRTITGTVTAKSDGGPIPAVSVVIKNTTIGTQTDMDGKFSISAPTGAVLVFRSVGFTPREVTLGASSVVNLSLEDDSKLLGEVVVTALGISRDQKSLGYSVSKIGGESLTEARETNIVNSLSGKVAGAQVTGTSGNLGGSSKVTIRGSKSILGDNNALFVIDGVPVDNSNYTTANQARGSEGFDYGNAIQDINPNDIESMSILKGAAAAALYGSRASNGVVMITTKKGSAKGQKGVGVTYDFGTQFDAVSYLPKYQNSYGGGSTGGFTKFYYNDNPTQFGDRTAGTYNDNDGKGSYDLLPSYTTDESWGPKLDGQLVRHYWSWDKDKSNPDFGKVAPWSANPNNIGDFYNTGNTMSNSVAMSGANEKGAFRLSYTNVNQKGIMPGAKLNRNNIGFNGSYNFTQKLTANISANYVKSAANGRANTGYSGIQTGFTAFAQRQWDMERMKNYKYADGTQITWNRTSWDNATPKYTNNPFWERYENSQNDGRERFFGNMELSYKLTNALSVSGKVMTDYYDDKREERIAAGSQEIPFYSNLDRSNLENNYQAMLNFNKSISDKFSVTAMAGANRMIKNYSLVGGQTVGGLIQGGFYNINNSKQPALISDRKVEQQVNSFFGSTSFGYNNLLYLDLTARNEWSSVLPVANNSYFFPAVSSSLIISELGPLKNLNWLSFGKVRASWASVGSSNIDPYSLFGVYDVNTLYGTKPNLTVPNVLNNSELKPEITEEFEVGADLKFFSNRLGIDFSYYDRKTKNQLIPLALSGETGYTAANVNAGLVSNKGFEFLLTGTPLKFENGLQWDMSLAFAKNNNMLVKLGYGVTNVRLANAPFAVSVNATEGQPYGTILGYDYEYNAKGEKIVLANGTYARSAAVKPIGNITPDFTGGLTNTLSYKSLSFSALVDFQKGGDFFSTTTMFGKGSGVLEETAANGIRENGIIVPGVKADGTPNDVVIDANTHFNDNGGYRIGKADIWDASYMYLREVKLGYSLPTQWYKGIGVQNVKLSLVGRNLWLIDSKSPHVDPSNLAVSTGNVQGIEGGGMPSVRSFGVNLSLGF